MVELKLFDTVYHVSLNFPLQFAILLKGHYIVLEKKFKIQLLNINNINEVIVQSQMYLFFP